MLYILLATGFGLLLLFGYAVPNSIPGKFLWAFLNALGMAGDKYKARNSIANYNAALNRTGRQVGSGAMSAGEYEALIASRTREKGELQDEADQIEAELDVLDDEKVPDTDPQKVRKGERLIEVQNRLENIDADLKRYGQTQQNTITMLRESKDKVIKGQRRARELEQDLNMSETESRLARMNSAFNPDAGHDTMDEADRLVQEQIDKNRGRTKVFQEVMGEPGEDRDLKDKVTARKTANFLAARRAQKTGTDTTAV